MQYSVSGSFHAALFVFSLTDTKSFNSMEEHLENFVKTNKHSKSTKLIVVGTHLDIVESRVNSRYIKRETVEEWLIDWKDDGFDIDYRETGQDKVKLYKLGLDLAEKLVGKYDEVIKQRS